MVLADVPKRELDEEMQRTLHGTRLHWVTRCGVEWNGVEQPRAIGEQDKTARHALRPHLLGLRSIGKRCYAPSALPCCVRRGAPHSAKDLETVAAAHAKTVILLHPDEDEVRECGAWAGQLGHGLAAPVRVLVRAVKSE